MAMNRNKTKQTKQAANSGGLRLPMPISKFGPLYKVVTAAEASQDNRIAKLARMIREEIDGYHRVCLKKIKMEKAMARSIDLLDICVSTIQTSTPSSSKVNELVRVMLLYVLEQNISERLMKVAVEQARHHVFRLINVVGKPSLPPDLIPRATEANYYGDSFATAALDLPTFVNNLAQVQKRKQVGLGTGLDSIDRHISGLFGLTIVAGDIGVGKTTLVNQLVGGVVDRHTEVGIIYLDAELSKDRVYLQHLARKACLEKDRIVSNELSSEERNRIEQATQDLKTGMMQRFRYYDCRKTLLNVSTLESYVEGLKKVSGVDQVITVIDSLQKLQIEAPIIGLDESTDEPIHRQLNELEIARSRIEMLQRFQGRSRRCNNPLGDPLVIISRVRKRDNSQRLELADIYGAGDVGFDADVILLMETMGLPTSPDVTPTAVNVAKVRDWGNRADIRLDFWHRIATFREAGVAPGVTVSPIKSKRGGREL